MEKFQYLQNLEKELDNTFFKTKLLIEESYCQRPICTKTLQISVKIKKGSESSLLTIGSRLLGDTVTLETRIGDLLNSFYVFGECDSTIENKGVVNPCLSTSVDNNIFEWHSECGGNFIDGFSLSICPSISFLNCYFEFKNCVDQYRISEKLRSVIERRVETKTRAIIEVWKYIMANKLFDNSNRTAVNCDDKLRNCFQVDSFKITDLDRLVSNHLLNFEPVCMRIPIVDGYKAMYNLKIDLDDLNEMPKLYSNPAIVQLENKIREI
ncbi:SWI/SNF-related matrix-associated actin-dependent regulator of chromatin subfamily D member 1, partial [Dictyocoela roeselum]